MSVFAKKRIMKENQFFISICIPSYNRPSGLKRLLESIDSKEHINDIQIVICEDNAPKRIEIKAVVDEYLTDSPYAVKYVENHVNYGHGKNWRECSTQADGEYLIYMGDDDVFIPEALDTFIDWVKGHNDLGYILRAYRSTNPKGRIEYFKYYGRDIFYEPGEKPFTDFFLKSVFMSGYTIKREYAIQYTEDHLDSTLYFQLYLMGEVCMNYSSAYCNIPIAEFVGDGVSYFGTNDIEKDLFTPGVNAAGSLTSFFNYFKITKYFDQKYGINSTDIIKMELSKYSSYPTMCLYRGYGVKQYITSCRELRRIGLDCSKYFNLYYIGLLIFGTNICNGIVRLIKKILGKRLQL
jgi:glycosyltransferase involved in cell wall biosynthesis